MKRAKFLLAAFAAVLTFFGCSNDGDLFRLAALKNPFIGQWESNIPSMGGATGLFEFKSDGTFIVAFPDLPAEMGGPLGPFTGGYLVKDGVQVTFLSTDEGIGGFTFKVVDNDTISVTEAENDGSLTPGNTAPFTRVSDSAVNRNNTPFALTNPLIGGTWKETATPYQAEYTFNADGTGALSYTGGTPSQIAYTVFHDDYIADSGADILVVYMTATKTFSAYQFESAGINAISVKEIESVGAMQGPPPPAVEYGTAITFTKNNFDLSSWAGTWNAIDQYLDDPAFDQVWADAVTALTTAQSAADVDPATLKAMFAQMLRTDFKSCVIEGNALKIYHAPGASGSPAETITYAYSGIHTVTSDEGNQDWFKFTGNTAGQFKYLVLGPAHQDSPDSMLHFHLQYSADSFDAATADDSWVATVTPNTTTVTKIAEDLAAFPWALYAPMFVPNP
ncbi:MAG: ZinT/AdcA family metal-binding protein [Spirochaetaceae bacterium]|nr:ZinT/AdcA family metal-binding protein [Spirochaetaceae bacterium]